MYLHVNSSAFLFLTLIERLKNSTNKASMRFLYRLNSYLMDSGFLQELLHSNLEGKYDNEADMKNKSIEK